MDQNTILFKKVTDNNREKIHMKKMLTKIIIVSLILSLHVPLTNAEQLTDSESMELVKRNWLMNWRIQV